METITPPSILEHDLRQLRIKQSQLDLIIPQLVKEIEKSNSSINNLRAELEEMKATIREIKAKN